MPDAARPLTDQEIRRRRGFRIAFVGGALACFSPFIGSMATPLLRSEFMSLIMVGGLVVVGLAILAYGIGVMIAAKRGAPKP